MNCGTPDSSFSAAPRPQRSACAVVLVTGLIVLLAAGLGFRIGRRGLGPMGPRHPAPRWDRPPGPGGPAAFDPESPDARRRTSIAQQKVRLLDAEHRTLTNELMEYVLKPMAEKELAVGAGEDPEFIYNAKRKYLDQLASEKVRLVVETGANNARAARLAGESEDGKTPPEIEVQVLNNPRYAALARRLDEAAARVDDLKATDPADAKAPNAKALDPMVAEAKRRAVLAEARLNDLRDELRTVYLGEATGRLQARIREDDARLHEVNELIDTTEKELGKWNQTMSEYRILKKREQRLRERLDDLEDQIRRERLSAVDGAEASAAPAPPAPPAPPEP